ncbi:MAG: glycosyltransferase family 4 protein [Pseudomonadota bacterium]
MVFAGLNPLAPKGGGELATRAILHVLVRHHDLRAVAMGKTPPGVIPEFDVSAVKAPEAVGFPWGPMPTTHERNLAATLARDFAAKPPDLLLVNHPAWVNPARLPKQTKLVVFVHSPMCFGLLDPTPERWRRALSGPSFALRRRWYMPMLQRADLIISNSDFMGRQLSRRFGLTSVVVPPVADVTPATDQTPDPHDAPILFSGLDPWKGAELAIEIASELRNRSFVFLAGGRPTPSLLSRAKGLANVTVKPWTDDMPALYRSCRLVLVPSLWQEPFGRIAVEAAAHCRPVIARDVGGLSEAVGAAGILMAPSAGVDAWCQAIAALDDAQTYDGYVSDTRSHRERFMASVVLARLEYAVKQATGLDLGVAAA